MKKKLSTFFKWVTKGILRLLKSMLNYVSRLFKSIFLEFNTSSSDFYAVHLSSKLLRLAYVSFLIISSYLLVRTALYFAFFEKARASEFMDKLYGQNWFEVLFSIFLIGVIITTIIRLIWPIRFSQKGNLIFLVSFLFYCAEKYALHDYTFYSSKLVQQDYFSVLILPPLIEIFLRITYAFRGSGILINKSIFEENSPISSEAEDKTTRKYTIRMVASELNKSYFKNAFSIGIVGDWGVGKTSFVRALEKKLQNTSIIVHFNPWLSIGRNSLVQEFIDSLKERLGKYDKSLIFNLDDYLKSLVDVEKNVKTNVIETISKAFDDKKSSKSEFEIIKESLKRLRKRIVVIIDDFDRLDKQEIIDVLKLIRNTGNFSNTIYIACYDKIYLLHALQNLSKRNLNIILDKYFDIEIPLSPIPQNELRNLIDDKFFKKYSEEITTTESLAINAKLTEINPFAQFRETKKFLSALILNYELYGRRLYIQDFFLFEILKVKYPFLPNLLWTERINLFTDFGSPAIKILMPSGSDSKDKGDLGATRKTNLVIEAFLKDAETEETRKSFLSQADITLIVKILKELFPEKLSHPSAIQEINTFESYFYYNISDSVLLGFDLIQMIKSEDYLTHEYFKASFDVKKENYLMFSLFDPDYVGRLSKEFSSNSIKIFQFLLFLVEWSEGRLSLVPFVKAYNLFNIPNKGLHFESLLEADSERVEVVPARTNFIATIIRSFIYEEDFKIGFASIASLKRVNEKLFNRYLDQSLRFSNQTFDIFYHQVDSIDRGTGKIKLTQQAIERFKKFILLHPENYLDLNIRSAMIPNFDLNFVFEPFTFQLFESKDSFKQFINSSSFDEAKKTIMCGYVDSAKLNEYSVYEFHLSEDELKNLPNNFINAWARIPSEIIERVRAIKTKSIFIFKNQEPPKNDPNSNDHYYESIFELTKNPLEIFITPKDSLFWRFGFKFSRNSNFPTVEQGRHGNPEYADIHLSIGDPTEGTRGKLDWNFQNRIQLTEYEVKHLPTESTFTSYDRYNGETLKLSWTIVDEDTSKYKLEIFLNETSLGFRTYKLDRFKYFRLSGWCDQRPFELSVEMVSISTLDI